MADYDTIKITDLLIRCIIGINDDERSKKQDVLINIVLSGDFKDCAISDSIDDALNYKTITKNVIAYAESSSFNLVETLAEKIADLCLEESRCKAVKVRIEKPGALRFAKNVGISIDREREKNKYVIGVSGNINTLLYLPAAVRQISNTPGIQVTDSSTFYITEPEFNLEQPSYCNGAVSIVTEKSRSDLKKMLYNAETSCGRARGKDKYQSRTVDLDILVENGNLIDEDIKDRWYLQLLIAELTGILPSDHNAIPDDPVIDRNLESSIRNIVSSARRSIYI